MIPVPKGTKARELAVEIKKTRLKAGFKGQPPIMEVCWLVDEDNSGVC